jgi:signal transduction histidine kinase
MMPLEQEAERFEELQLLHDAARALDTGLDLPRVLEAATRVPALALQARTAILRLVEDDGALVVASRLDAGAEGRPIPGEEELARRVWAEGRPLAAPEVEPGRACNGEPAQAPVPLLVVPLAGRGGRLGTLAVCGRLGHLAVFRARDLRRLTLLAEPIARALEEARRYAAAEQRAGQLAALREISQAVVARLDLPAVLEAVVAGALRLLNTQHVQIILLDEATGQLQFGAAVGPEADRVRRQTFQLGHGINGVVAATKRARVLNDYRGSPYALADYPDIVATITAPVLFGERLLGVLHSHTTRPGRRFSSDDLRLMQMLATHAAIAIENARVYRRLEEAHREIQRTHHQLVQQERLAALGEMAAHVVHEIRNPLVAIGGFARRLAQRLAGREPEGVYAQVIAREVDRLERIVHDVRGMSREMGMHLGEANLHVLLQECLVLVADRLAAQQVTLRTALAAAAPLLRLDAMRVKQAVLNLVTNALEAMPSGGQLTLGTSIVPAGPSVPSSGLPVPADTSPPAPDGPPDRATHRLAPDEWAVVSVDDTGGGIAPRVLEEMFTPFFTTKELGTGLGLALVRRIARFHGGHVEVDNRPGQGVTFRLWLPAVVPEPGAARGGGGADEAHPGGG